MLGVTQRSRDLRHSKRNLVNITLLVCGSQVTSIFIFTANFANEIPEKDPVSPS